MPRKTSHCPTGRGPTYIIGEFSIDFEVMPNEFELLNGHIMYFMLQNHWSIISTMKVIGNLLNVGDVSPLQSPVQVVVLKYNSLLRRISRDFDTFVAFSKKSFKLPDFTKCKESLLSPVSKEVVKKSDAMVISINDMTAASPSTRTRCTRCDSFRNSIRFEKEKGQNYRKIISRLKADIKQKTPKRFNELIKRKNQTILRLKRQYKLALLKSVNGNNMKRQQNYREIRYQN